MRRVLWIGIMLFSLASLVGAAQAETVFIARLTGSQEVPAVATGGSGSAVFRLTPDGLEYSVTVDNLSGAVTAAHIHAARAGLNGGVRRDLIFTGNTANGLWTPTELPQPFTATELAALFGGGLYVNVHTAANPGGEVRGQILPGTAAHLCAMLDGNQEVPAVATGASGTASVVLTEEGLRYAVTVAGLSGAVTAAHIHGGALGVNGGVLAALTFSGTNAIGFVPRASLTNAQIREILTGNTYVNVHTAANPGGEIRGQLTLNGATGFTAGLEGAQEVPPNGSTGKGTAVLSLTPSGLRFELTVDGLTGPITGAHIHRAPTGSNGPVVRDIQPEFVGTTGTGLWRMDDASALTADLVAALIAGDLYINVHTAAFPGGEIRGQITPRPGLLASSYSARLTGAQERPAVATAAQGTGWFVVTAAGIDYRYTVSGLSGAITAAHLHGAGIGVNGGVIVNLPFVGTTGSGSFVLGPADMTSFMTGLTYINVHTGANPGGEIRGQVLPASGAAMEALLTSNQEVPPNGSTGHATACMRLTKDGLQFRFTASGLTGAITAAHFHGNERGQNGGVTRGLGAGELVGVNGNGVWKPTDASALTAAQILSLYMGRQYLNLHTGANPGGEIRGQVDLAGGMAKGASLSGLNEVPPNGSGGAGSLAAVLTSQGLFYRATASDLDGAFTAAHFHNAPAGANGGVVRDLTGEFTGLSGEGLWLSSDAQPLSPALEGEYVRNRIYFNLHTSAFPGGEVRGDFGPVFMPSSVDFVDRAAALRLSNSPNPVAAVTTVRFALPSASQVDLQVFDLSGRRVATLFQGRLEAGDHGVPFDAAGLSNGVYFYRLSADGVEAREKMLVVR